MYETDEEQYAAYDAMFAHYMLSMERVDRAQTWETTEDLLKCHPFKSQSEILEFCIENEIALTAYSPLAKGRIAGDDVLKGIGRQYDKTAAQVALRWLLQQELVAAVPKAATPQHIEENFDVFDFELSDSEMERIFDLQGGLLSRLRGLLGL